ncbi:hypothetical protein [Porphyromonas endodontalis]|uniref:hypothetical protein n=1 Tax=Porphyromonas endodontalis TaxID=28124 RepID=UPI0028EAA04D|nr:hypothetical protein [Porphyromonas endodontalis]
MTITDKFRVKQPFLGIEEVPNNDSPFWGEKKIYRVIFPKESGENAPKTSLKQKKEVPTFFRIDTLIPRHKRGSVMPVDAEKLY